MHVTGDRTAEHGLATVGYDDEGVAAQSWDLITGGVLTGYQLDRRIARLAGLGRSNGCAFADSPGHMPIQRMANVSLQPAAGGPATEELIAGVSDGIYIVGDKSWSIDMQRYNFQFTGQRFYRISHGRLAGQLRDVAYQATTTDFWNSMEAVGGPQTYVLGGAFNCGKGQPGQVAPVSHGCPAALLRGHPRSSTRRRRQAHDRGSRPQETVERALAAARCDDCVVIADETSAANLRWAGNTLTTNGVSRSRQLTVIAISRGADGTTGRRGVPGGRARRPGRRRGAGRRRRPPPDGSPAEDALPAGGPGRPAGLPHARVRDAASRAGTTRCAAPRSGCSRVRQRPSARRSPLRPARAGSCTVTPSTTLTCTFLGTSTGLAAASRPADRQGSTSTPRSADLTRSAWAGCGHPGLHRRGRGGARRGPGAAAGLGRSARSSCPPGGTRRCCRRPPWPTCSSTCTGRPGPRTRWTAGRVFSKPGGGTRVGERLATPAGDAAQRPGRARAGLRAVRDRARLGRDASVFDNGLALRADRVDPRRRAGRADPDQAHRRGCPGCRSPRPSTT